MPNLVKDAWKTYRIGDKEKAAELFEKATSDSNRSQTHTQHGMFLLRTDDFHQAALSFEKAIELEPRNPAPLFFLALARELEGERDVSLKHLAELRELEPHHQGCTSLELLQNLRDGDPLPYLAGFGFGPEPAERREAPASKRIAAALGMGDPSWLPAELTSSSFLLGPILVEVESKLHPLEIRTLEHHPNLLPENLNSVKVEKRSFSEELSCLGSSLKAGPILKRGERLLNKAFGRNDQPEQKELLKKAVKYLRLARKIDPYGFRVSYHLGETYVFLAREGPGKPYSRFRLLQAEASFLESTKKEGVNPYLLLYLGYIQHFLGRLHLAIKYYRAATKKFEKLPEAYYGEGQCHLLLGDRQKAKELLLKAAGDDLALARERLNTFANLLDEHGKEFFEVKPPVMPDPPVVEEEETLQEEPEAPSLDE